MIRSYRGGTMAFSFAATPVAKQKILTVVWLLIQVCVFAFVVTSFVVPSGHLPPSYEFLAVFDALLVLALSVGGTIVLRKHRTPGALGFLVGVSLMMSLVMLQNAVLAGGDLSKEDSTHHTSSVTAVCAFSVFLFLLYAVFTAMLATWRGVLVTFDRFEEEEGGTSRDGDVEVGKASSSAPDEVMM